MKESDKETEINENDAANLVTLIYGRNLPEIIEESHGNSKGNRTGEWNGLSWLVADVGELVVTLSYGKAA